MVLLFALVFLAVGIVLYKSERLQRAVDAFAADIDRLIRREWRAYLARRDRRNEYTDLNLNYWQSQFFFERTFTARTLLNFKVEYKLQLLGKRVDDEEFKKYRMLDENSRQDLAGDVNEESFLPYLEKERFFFSITVPSGIDPTDVHAAFSPTLYQLVEKDGSTFLRRYASGNFKAALHKISFKKKGCEVNLGFHLPETLPDSLIDENFAMLTEEQKTAILSDDSFAAIEEMLAVAVLKRRLDILGRASKQRHECDEFSVDIEKAGSAARIKWRFKERRDSGFQLLGFRRAGGFFNDAWDTQNNGTLVIHTDQNNEIVEFLDVGQAHFYTLFIQWPGPEGRTVKSSAVRFQVTIAPEKEIEAMEATLKRVAERKPPTDPARENMSQALKELGSYVEMDTAFDAMEKSFIDQIGKGNYSEADKQRKIERLQDIVRQIRSKYEP